MASTNLKSSGRRGPCNAWNREQRLALHLLNERFPTSSDSEYRARLFNVVFADALSSCGLQGLTAKTLNAQYSRGEREKPANLAKWAGLYSEPNDDAGKLERQELFDRFAAAEAELRSGGPGSTMQQPESTVRAQTSHTTATTHLRLDRTPQTRTAAERTPSKRKSLASELESGLSLPLTPTKRPKKSFSSAKSSTSRRNLVALSNGDKILKPRRHGGAIPIRPDEVPRLSAPMAVIPEDMAHPPHSDLLFRVWSVKSQGMNADAVHGFVSGVHSYSNLPPQPAPDVKSLWVWIETHLNKCEKVASPFISTANSLAWVVRQGLIRNKNEDENQFISVIDASKLDKTAIFHASPLHTEVKNHKAYTSGAWCYGGNIEFLIWQQIPREAIIKTVPTSDLLQLARRTPALGHALRLDRLDVGKWDKVQRNLKEDGIDLLPGTVGAIAKLLRFIGVLPTSPLAHITCAVSEIVRGWCLFPSRRNDEEWYEVAAGFAHAFCKPQHLGSRIEEDIKSAFLYGVQVGVGKINALHNAEGVRKMQVSAKGVGLQYPTEILTKHYAASAESVIAYGSAQEKRYKDAPNFLVLPPTRGEANLTSPAKQPIPATPSRASSHPQPQQPTRKHQAPGRARPEPTVLIHTPAPNSASTDRPRRNATKKPNYAETRIIISDDEDEESEDEDQENFKAPNTLATPTNLSDWEQISYDEDEDEDEEIGITEEAEDGDEIIVF
ncbi:hypothetical protein MBLNU230_g2386t1 [Neophaeotheca triangularis]